MHTVAVLYGGPSLEHDISIASGTQVLEHLDRSRFSPIPVLLNREGGWEVDGAAASGVGSSPVAQPASSRTTARGKKNFAFIVMLGAVCILR